MTRILFFSFGILFIAMGFWVAYGYMPWGPGRESSVYEILLEMSLLGLPAGLLCVSIAASWKSIGNSTIAYQTGLVVLMHILNLYLWIRAPYGDITRLCGGGLALLFSIHNFWRALK